MAFSQAGISGINVQADGPELLIRWTAGAPQGTVFQVYVDRRLNWYGTSRQCHVPIPAGASGRNVWIDVARVGTAEAPNDFSSSLASIPFGGGRVELRWPGGTYLDPSGAGAIGGYRIYLSPSPGTPVNLSNPIDEVPAYTSGRVTDGFGLGGFGLGGFGRSATPYKWSTVGLPGGVWQFAVVPFDLAGDNRGPGQTVQVTVTAAPRPPAMPLAGRRLTCTYSGPATRQVVLQWSASPSSAGG
jgi:hypothetical protein